MQPDKEREAGIALLIVMVGLAILSALAIGMVIASRFGIQQAHTDLVASERRAFFDAIILQTVVDLLEVKNPNRPRVDGVPQVEDVLGQKVMVAVTSEFGKVDINAADPRTLAALFEASGEGPAVAAADAHDVDSWRSDGDDGVRRRFRTTAEITEVEGITADLYHRVSSAITIYSGRGSVDRDTASLLALQALPNVSRLDAEQIVHDRLQDQQQRSTNITSGRIAEGTSTTGWAIEIAANFSFGQENEQGVEIVRLTGDPALPFLALFRQF